MSNLAATLNSAKGTDMERVCGNCQHFKGPTTPTGKWKHAAGECNGVVTLVAPMSYRVVLNKHYVWPKDDARKCPCYEVKA